MPDKNESENQTTELPSRLDVLLCPECLFWSDIRYKDWGACDILKNRLGFCLSDGDSEDLLRVDTPKNFGCAFGERKT